MRDKFLTKVSNPAGLCSVTCIVVFIHSLPSEILDCLFRNKLIIACMSYLLTRTGLPQRLIVMTYRLIL